MSRHPAELLLLDVLGAHVGRAPDRPAVRCGGSGLSWAELSDRVERLAAGFRAIGVGPGDRVAWLAQNCHRYLESLLACSALGAVFAPVNWRQSAVELAAALDDIDPVLVLWQTEELEPLVAAVRPSAGRTVRWVQIDGGDAAPDGYEALLASSGGDGLQPEGHGSDPVLMLRTAAFDGRPAGALLTQTGLLVQASYGVQFGGAAVEDVYLNAGPLFHVGTLKTTLATFLAGGVNVFARRVDPEELCRLIDTERCTGAFLQPPTIAAMTVANADGRFDLSSLRSKPGPPGWDAMVSPAPPGRFRSGYGQTELGGVVTFVDAERPAQGSAGWPAPLVRIAALDPAGAVLAPGEVGELAVRGPVVLHGYHRRPELTADRHRRGWHRTADLGRVEPDGSVTFVGPAARLIKSAAENIYPAEVEACLREHSSVADVAVLGAPDPTWGQSVVAVVVPVEGAVVDPHALIEHCRARIASYKKPRSVVVVDGLPRRDGQLDRDALDATYGGGGYPTSG